MMKKVWTVLPVVVAFAATPGFAQDTGFSPRVELRVGHDELRADVEIRDSAFTDDASENGIGYGIEAGVDVRVSSTFLVGGYVGLEDSDIEGCSEVFDDDFDNDEACITAGRNFTAGVRAGLPLSDGGLIYVKGGYSNAKIRASFAEDANDIDSQLFDDRDTVAGYHLGAGFEVGLGFLGITPNFYAKGEYVYTRYKDAFKSDLGQGESFGPTRHQLVAGVGIRFGGRVAEEVYVAPPVAAPLPEPAPATQTCADGSVILATDICPAPPMPMPAPAPAPEPERG